MECQSGVPAPPSESLLRDPEYHLTRMTDASDQGDLETVEECLRSYLQRAGTSRLYELDSALGQAILSNRRNVIDLLLCAGVPLERMHYYQATKVKSAAIYEVFLKHGWDINKPLDVYEPPALGVVVDDWDLTRWFLDHGADPNARCYLDYTPMSYAIKEAPMSTVKFLFKQGGDIKRGQLVHHAVERKLPDVVEMLALLLQMGAEINKKKYENNLPSWNMHFFMGLGTSLHGATRAENLAAVTFLLLHGSDPKIKDSRDRTPYDYAVKKGYTEIAIMLKGGVDVAPDRYLEVSV